MNKQFKAFAILGTISTSLFLFGMLFQWFFFTFIARAIGTGKVATLFGNGISLSIFLAGYGLLLAGYASIGRFTASRLSSFWGLIGCGIYSLVMVMWIVQLFLSTHETFNSLYPLITFFVVTAFVFLGISVLLLPKEALPKWTGILGACGWFILALLTLVNFFLYSPQFHFYESFHSSLETLRVLILLLRLCAVVLTALPFVAILSNRRNGVSRFANVVG